MKLPIYRSEALERLASPDRLDQLIHITSPQAWMTLAVFGTLISMIMLWGVFGEIVSTVEQDGLLKLSNNIVMVTSSETGRIDQILVEPGERVSAGQELAIIALPTTNDSGEAGQQIITSPGAGEVVSVRLTTGSPVSAGTAIVSLQDYSTLPETLTAITYLTLGEIQELEQGMPALLRPVATNSNLEGYLRGRVIAVSPYPATADEIQATLGTNSVISEAGSALFEVRVVPEQGASGYVWTVTADSDFQLISGMAVNIIIETNAERPLNLVFKVSG